MGYIIHLRKKVDIIRLWHYKLLPYLPNSQLIAQKRECDLIWKDIANGKQTNHILINYIWSYEDYKYQLIIYYWMLKIEFKKRGFNFRESANANLLIEYRGLIQPFAYHHNDKYLVQCFYNLQEKYDRGQKDFTYDTYKNLLKFMEDLL